MFQPPSNPQFQPVPTPCQSPFQPCSNPCSSISPYPCRVGSRLWGAAPPLEEAVVTEVPYATTRGMTARSSVNDGLVGWMLGFGQLPQKIAPDCPKRSEHYQRSDLIALVGGFLVDAKVAHVIVILISRATGHLLALLPCHTAADLRLLCMIIVPRGAVVNFAPWPTEDRCLHSHSLQTQFFAPHARARLQQSNCGSVCRMGRPVARPKPPSEPTTPRAGGIRQPATGRSPDPLPT